MLVSWNIIVKREKGKIIRFLCLWSFLHPGTEKTGIHNSIKFRQESLISQCFCSVETESISHVMEKKVTESYVDAGGKGKGDGDTRPLV